jgi:hypothetical protein
MTMPTKFVKYCAMVLFAAMAQTGFCQDFQLEVNVRANSSLLLDNPPEYDLRDYTRYPIGVSVEALYFVKDFIGVGLYYSRSVVDGECQYYGGTYFGGYFSEESALKFQQYGIAAQLTTNRKRRVQGYSVVRVGQYEWLEDFYESSFAVGNKGISYGAGLGCMIRISRSVSFNIIEANYTFLPKEFSFEDRANTAAVGVQSGLSIKFLQKK